MRVLLLTPNFWTSGTVTFIRELQSGWPADWPKPVIATVTKSGKRSSKWGRPEHELKRADATPWEPDVCDSRERLVDYADEFDIVHVNEAETRPVAQQYWYEMLERLRVPWTLQLHGNRYERIDWRRILAAKSFTGVVWQTPGNVPEALYRSSRVKLVPLPRPWNMRLAVTPESPDVMWPVGFHGRFTPDKGVAHVAALVKHAKIDVCMHGASPGGGYPYSYGLQKHLLGEAKFTAEQPWTCANPEYGDALLRYSGPYADGVQVSRHHKVHVSATRRGFSSGTEYTLLEAINAGCRIVQPDHMTEPSSTVEAWTYEWEPRGMIGAFRDRIPSLIRAVREALADTSYDPGYNRSVVAVRHDPAVLARTFFGVAASRT